MDYEYVIDKASFPKLISSLKPAPYIFLDTETTGDKIRLVQIGDYANIFVIDLFEVPEAVEVLQVLLSAKGIIGHNLKYDLKYLYRYNIHPYATFDTMIASQLLGFEKLSLSHVARVLLSKSLDKSFQASDWAKGTLDREQIEYAATDVEVLRGIFDILRERLNSLPEVERGSELLRSRTARIFGLKNPAAIVEMAFVQEVAKLELNGIPVDAQEIEKLEKEFGRRLQKKMMDFIIKHRTDPLSTKQLGRLLTERLGLNLPLTMKGNVATDDKTLSEFSHVREVQEILEIRKIKKALDKLKELRTHIRNSRVFPEFRQIGAITGRMSSSNPNVQNIPRDMRGLFKASEGKVLVIADFSQIELRIAAEYVRDERMMEAIRQGRDLHRYTASLVLGKPETEISKEERQLAKALNFGLIYGISAKGLADYARTSYGVEISLQEAERFRKRFFEAFKSFRDWHAKVKVQLREEREVSGSTLLGRPFKATTFTDAVNYPIQGTGADLLKLAVLMFEVEIKRTNLEAKLVNLVHDEIVVETRKDIADAVKACLEEAMRKAGKMVLRDIPVEVESTASPSWSK